MPSRIHFCVEDADNANRPLVDTIEDEVLTDATVAQVGRGFRCEFELTG